MDAQLVGLINKDYADFVNLSSSILGTDVMIHSVRSQLSKVANEVNLVSSSVESRSLALQDRQAQLRSAEDARRALLRLVAAHQLLEELESLLQDVSVERSVLDRAVALATELACLASRMHQARFIQQMRPRIAQAEQRLERALKEQFLEALAAADRAGMSHAMRAYGSMGRDSVPRALFRNVVMGPLVAELVTLKELEGGVRTSCNGLSAMLESLVSLAVARVSGPLGDSGLVQAAFDEIVEQLSSKLGSQIFATGIPEVFHANLLLAKEFVQKWESRVVGSSSARALADFRTSESLQKWNRAWKIEVYFTLRAQEVIRGVELALSSVVTNVDLEASFAFPAVAACVEQMHRLWLPDMFLPGLEVSFLRLGFQIVSRLRHWASSSFLDGEQEGSIAFVLAAHHDLARVASVVLKKDWSERMAACLKMAVLPRPVTAAITLAAHELEEHALPPLSRSVVRRLGADCLANLQFVRKISSLHFRADASDALPQRALPDIDNVLQPLAILNGPHRQEWSIAVATVVLQGYADLAREVLVQAAATQKFIQGRGGAASSNGMARIVAQFRLDAARLIQLLHEKHNVQLPSLEDQLKETIEKI